MTVKDATRIIRQEEFRAVYQRHLTELVKVSPRKFAYGPERVEEVSCAAAKAAASGTAILSGEAFQRTIKELGMRKSPKALRDYLQAEDIK